jgi:pimeloyl-ACP methyl ester carboxylesterase
MRFGLRFLLCTALLCVPAPAALAAPPAPFGHACQPRDGALFCPTADDAARVPSFDGVPLDVDVWLPATGNGPFPTIVMLHGFGGSKMDFQGPQPANYNGMYFARKGYAVVLPSARGFGRSCGVPDSRTAGCERGWLHLDDQRYEARDVQWLLARLVDQLVARPDALGVTGISYGAGTAMQLAILADRIRRPDGATESWQSPDGVPLTIAAAWPRWPWSDLADALMPNGRLGLRTYASPVGVDIQAYVNALYGLANTTGFVAPLGADPEADLTGWKQRIDRGEPYGADERANLSGSTTTTASSDCRSTRGSRRCSSSRVGPTTSSPSGRACGSTTSCARRARRRRSRCSSAISAIRARPTTRATSRPSTPRASPSSTRA